MSNQVQFPVFNFNSSAVRVIIDPNQEFWFCGTDVCDVLGYSNAPDALAKHCKPKGIAKRYTPTKGGNQELTFINEPNLYRLIIKSRKPEAEKFEAWVFEEVLPQIRKTGKYTLQNSQQNLPLTLPEKPRKIQGTTRAAEGEYLYTREFSAMEIDHLAKLWDIAEEQHKFIESLTPLFETMQSEQWFKKHSRALNCFNHHNYSYHILSEMCEDVEEWTGIMPSIRAVKLKGKYYSRF
ncbi:TPA: Bro-N domain-containing protein [Mannheimia haemolytica]|nr:Bro-N domain-containing protein [Mannheimia haemolytica]